MNVKLLFRANMTLWKSFEIPVVNFSFTTADSAPTVIGKEKFWRYVYTRIYCFGIDRLLYYFFSTLLASQMAEFALFFFI